MQISSEDYVKERNDETTAIKDMSIEQIKARILDYEQQLWRIKARQQSCFAVIQEDERKRSLANEMKNIVSKDVIVPTADIREEAEKESKKVQSKLDKQVESWRKMGLPEDKIRVMARMIEPSYRFDGEKDVKKYYITCPEHGKIEITKAEYQAQVVKPEGWHCPKQIGVAPDKDGKEVAIRCDKESQIEETTEIVAD